MKYVWMFVTFIVLLLIAGQIAKRSQAFADAVRLRGPAN
jgi:hypothetical protein